MNRILRATISLALFGLGACAAKPTPYETLPQLKEAVNTEVASTDQSRQYSALAQLVSEEKHLHGLTRPELAAKVGAGQKCLRLPLCRERGFEDDDLFYEVGMPAESVPHVPILIVGFNRFGKVERTFVMRVE
jgi:hypothetical protein